jgi:hypothetical protein
LAHAVSAVAAHAAHSAEARHASKSAAHAGHAAHAERGTGAVAAAAVHTLLIVGLRGADKVPRSLRCGGPYKAVVLAVTVVSHANVL